MPHSPQDSNSMHIHQVLVLAAAALGCLGGCQAVQLAGRAPTAPTLLPVSTSTYQVSLGTRERLKSEHGEVIEFTAPRTTRAEP